MHFRCVTLLFWIVLVPLAALAHPGIHEQEKAAEDALAEKPKDPAAHLARGKVHYEVGEWDAALARFHRARALGAPVEVVAILEGDTYLAAGFPLTARERYGEASSVDPRSPKARIGRARALVRLGRLEEADADYRVAFANLDRVAPSLVLERRDALVLGGRSQDALLVLDRQIEKAGGVPSLQLAAVDLEVAAERYDDALRRIDILLEQVPGHPVWAARRAEILDAAGRSADAQVAYRDALAMVQSRTKRRRSRKLEELEGELRAALARYAEVTKGTKKNGGNSDED